MTLVNSFGKDREEILLNQNNSKHCWKTITKRPSMAVANVVPELFSVDLLEPFIRVGHGTILLTFGFDMPNSFEKPL